MGSNDESTTTQFLATSVLRFHPTTPSSINTVRQSVSHLAGSFVVVVVLVITGSRDRVPFHPDIGVKLSLVLFLPKGLGDWVLRKKWRKFGLSITELSEIQGEKHSKLMAPPPTAQTPRPNFRPNFLGRDTSCEQFQGAIDFSTSHLIFRSLL